MSDDHPSLGMTLADLAEVGLAAPLPEGYRGSGTLAAFEAGKRAAANAIIHALLTGGLAANRRELQPHRRDVTKAKVSP